LIFFPEWYSADMNYVEKYKRLVQAMADDALGVEGAHEDVKELAAWFFFQRKIHSFNPFEAGNVIVEQEKGFELVVASMEENGATDAREMTEFSFYCRLQYLENKVKQLEKYGTGK
jgi:hypothetical protein